MGYAENVAFLDALGGGSGGNTLRDLPGSQLAAGWGAGVNNWQAGLGALASAIGRKFGADTGGLDEWVAKQKDDAAFYQRNAPGATEFFGDRGVTGEGELLDWLAYNFGQSAPYMLEMLVGGGVGSKVLRGVAEQAVGRFGEKALLDQAARRGLTESGKELGERALQELAAKDVATRWAAGAGATAASYPSAVGDILLNQQEAGGENLGTALAGGVPYALLNMLGGESAALRAATGGLGRRVAAQGADEAAEGVWEGTKALAGRTWRGENLPGAMVRGGAKAGLVEGASETGQEVINQTFGKLAVNPETDVLGPDALKSYAESFMAGLGMGGVMGGVSQVFAKPTDATPDAIAQRVEIARQAKIGLEQRGFAPDELRAEHETEQEQAAAKLKQEADFTKLLTDAQKSKTDLLKSLKEANEFEGLLAQEQQQTKLAQLMEQFANRRKAEDDADMAAFDAGTLPDDLLTGVRGLQGQRIETPPPMMAGLFPPTQRFPNKQDIAPPDNFGFADLGNPELTNYANSLLAELAVAAQAAPSNPQEIEELKQASAAALAELQRRDELSKTPFGADTLFAPSRMAQANFLSGVERAGEPGLASLQELSEVRNTLKGEPPAPRLNKPKERPLETPMEAALKAALRPLEEDKAWQQFLAEKEAQKKAEMDAAHAGRPAQTRGNLEAQGDMFGFEGYTPEEIAAGAQNKAQAKADAEAGAPNLANINDFISEGLQIAAEWEQAKSAGDTKALAALEKRGEAIYERMALGFPRQDGTTPMMVQKRGNAANISPTPAGKAAAGNTGFTPRPTTKETTSGPKTAKTKQGESTETPVETPAPAATEGVKKAPRVTEAFDAALADANAKRDAALASMAKAEATAKGVKPNANVTPENDKTDAAANAAPAEDTQGKVAEAPPNAAPAENAKGDVNKLKPGTRDHLRKWVERMYRPEDVDRAVEIIADFVEGEPGGVKYYLQHGWTAADRAAETQRKLDEEKQEENDAVPEPKSDESSFRGGARAKNEGQGEAVGKGNTEPKKPAEEGKTETPLTREVRDQRIAELAAIVQDSYSTDEEVRRAKLQIQALEKRAFSGAPTRAADEEGKLAAAKEGVKTDGVKVISQAPEDPWNEDGYDFNLDTNAPINPDVKTALLNRPTVASLLNTVATANGMPPVLKQLAKEIEKLRGTSSIKVRYSDTVGYDEKGVRIAGNYDFNTNTITIYQGGQNAHTIMHEIVHAITVNKLYQAQNLIDSGRTNLSEAEQRLVDGLRKLERLRQEVIDAIGPAAAEVYGLKGSIREFVAEAMTNTEFQDTLQKIASSEAPTAPSMWQKFVGFVRYMLGFKGAQMNSVLLRAMETIPDFVAMPPLRFTERAQILGGRSGNNFNTMNPLGDAFNINNYQRPSTYSFMELLAQRDFGMAWHVGVRNLASTIGTAVKHIRTMRGLGMLVPTAAVIQGRMSQVVQDKMNILNDLNHILRQFNKNMRFKKLEPAIKEALAATTLHMTPEEQEALLTHIVKIAHQHTLQNEKGKLYTVDNNGYPRLNPEAFKYTKDGKEITIKTRLTEEDFRKGVPIPNESKIVKPLEGLSKDEVAQFMAAYNSAMDAMIVGHLHMLQAADERAGRMMSNSAKALKVKHRGESEDFIKALAQLQTTLANQYRNLSTYDVKKHRVSSTEPDAVGASFTKTEELLVGLLKGEMPLTKENSNEFSKEYEMVLKTFGMTSDEFQRMIEPLKAQVAKKESASERTAKAKSLIGDIMEGKQAVELAESEAISTVQSIATMYIPIRRYGSHVMVLKAYDEKTGKDLSGWMVKQASPDGKTTRDQKTEHAFYQFHGEPEQMEAFHKEQNKELAGQTVTLHKIGEDGKEETRTARLAWTRPEPVKAYKVTPSRVRPTEVMHMLEMVGIKMNLQDRAKLIKASTNADAATRSKQLMRHSVPGYSMDFTRAISDHLGSIASLIAMRRHREDIENLLAQDAHWEWEGSEWEEGWKKAEEALKANPKNKVLQREFDVYEAARQRIQQGKYGDTVEVRNQMRKLVDYVFGQDQLEEDNNWITKARAVTTIMQLGGTLASAVTNLSSLPLHTFSFLTTYNQGKAFGGGFGAEAAFGAMTKAAKAMAPLLGKAMKQINPYAEEFFPEDHFAAQEQKARSQMEEWNRTHSTPKTMGDFMVDGYSGAHWEFLRKASAEGVLSAQRYNELLAQRKHSQFSPGVSKGIAHYMAMFTATEEFNRLVTGLSSFDLYYQENKKGGLSDEEASKKAYDQAVQAIYYTQGEYNMANRPRLFRNDLGSLVFLYKTFVVTSIELLHNLPPKGQAMFLGGLFMFAGVGGVPFYEELITVFDLIGRKTGITQGNAERTFQQFAAELGKEMGIPKLDRALLRGVIDTYLTGGTTLFGRAGIDVGLPMVGMLKPGTDFWKEMGRSFGATAGVLDASIATASELSKGDWEGALRQVPLTAARGLGDAYAFAKYDNVVNRRGQVVTEGMSLQDIMMRAVGFHPEEAQWANDMIRREEYTRAIAKEIKAGFIEEYNEAAVLKNRSRQREIEQMVAEHNKDFRGTALEILDFKKSAERSAKEAVKPILKRTFTTLSKAQRASTPLAEYQ